MVGLVACDASAWASKQDQGAFVWLQAGVTSKGDCEFGCVLQIEAEFKRFSKFIEPQVKIANYVGGIARKLNEEELRDDKTRPHIVIGTPGRLWDLVESNKLPIADIKFFVIDECDKILDQAGVCPCLPVLPACSFLLTSVVVGFLETSHS